MTPIVNRRSVLAGSAAIAAAPAFAARRTLDLSDPKDSLTAFIKLSGSVTEAWVYSLYEGPLLAIVPGAVPQPVCGFAGLIKTRWTPEADGTFTQEIYDNGYFSDLDTGEIIDTLRNPLTGETVRPQHFLVGPTTYTHGPGPRPWREIGDLITVSTGRGLAVPNPFDPAQWPRESPGDQLIYHFATTYVGRRADLEDDSLSQASNTYTWNAFYSWLPWMLMGQRPGFVYWQAQGRKLAGVDEVPDMMRTHIANTWPSYLDDGAPWTGRKDTSQAYMAERRPAEE
jgi:hypothetical protein